MSKEDPQREDDAYLRELYREWMRLSYPDFKEADIDEIVVHFRPQRYTEQQLLKLIETAGILADLSAGRLTLTQEDDDGTLHFRRTSDQPDTPED